MAMKQRRAFNARMMTRLSKIVKGTSGYDDNNVWVEAAMTQGTVVGVWTTGNRFTEFDKGISMKPTAGGERFSDFRTLVISTATQSLDMEDRLEYKGNYYNLIQQTPEDEFGFKAFLAAKLFNWTPDYGT